MKYVQYVSSYMHYIDECGEHLGMRICMEFCSKVLLLRCRTGKKKVGWICTLIIRGRYDLIGRAVWITNKVSAGKKLESVKSHDGSSWFRRLWKVGCCCCHVTNNYHYVMQPTSALSTTITSYNPPAQQIIGRDVMDSIKTESRRCSSCLPWLKR
jgi:hypothetical protein